MIRSTAVGTAFGDECDGSQMVPTAVGVRLVTVIAMVCVAVTPSLSLAVTVTVADPGATGVIVTVLAVDTLTVALHRCPTIQRCKSTYRPSRSDKLA